MRMPKPVVGITMGDPAGIGPEIIVKALRHRRVRSMCRPVVFGSARFPANATSLKSAFDIVEVETPGRVRVGKKSAASGRAAIAYLDRAVQCALRGDIDALVTAPLSKSAVRSAGARSFTGHTEYVAQKTKARSFAMMFWSKRLKVVLVTTHLPLRRVASSINTEKVLTAIRLSNDALKRLGCARPRIGVAGLNPHAGEDEAFGDEDARIIAPAVRKARRRGIDAEGPVSADTLFRAAYNRDYDLVVAMYHDQALAPFKMVAFDEGVNVTLGLPFVRTSVDHGTAFDIAGKGIASERSLVEAITLAVRLAK
jgi:4-hydroxythreonine-4-phosphate dehydrogenase